MNTEKLAENMPRIGLGAFLIVAGLSKFLILQYWTGYEPQIIVQILPASADELTLLGGVFEAILGALLVTGRKVKETSLIAALWLGAIMAQMINLGLWGLAIRDLGLTLYAVTVYQISR